MKKILRERIATVSKYAGETIYVVKNFIVHLLLYIYTLKKPNQIEISVGDKI